METAGLIDTHTHLLPGIDDGCKTVAESITCAKGLVAAGYTHAFCTPHIWPDLPENASGENIARRVNALQAEYDAAGIDLTLQPGGELNLLSGTQAVRGVTRDKIITYGLKGRFTLFDFWTRSAREAREIVLPLTQDLSELGITSILAHPERIAAFHEFPGLLAEFTAVGVKLQMNTWCLMEPPQSTVYQCAARWLQEGRYFIFGTDLHNPGGLDMRIDGLHAARRMIGEAAVRTLTLENPRLLLDEGAGL